MNAKLDDLFGKRFGRLVVVGRGTSLKNGPQWVTKCDCGNISMKRSSSLRYGRSKSCGCLRKEIHSTQNGMSGTRLYRIWDGMRRRCTNPNSRVWRYYGGRGIKMHPEWISDFKIFYEWSITNGYSDNLEIDRVNNDGGYFPENCRWTTHKINMGNRSRD